MKTFSVGRADKARLEIDLLRMIDTRVLVQANSGGGKSWLLRLVAERTGHHVQTIILDPEGEFATLREKLDIALVGREGEIPADPRAAGLLARKLMELKISAVVDLYDLKLPERRAFVRLFIESLLSIPKSLYHPALIALDEAHKFAPERGSGESESTGAVIDLASQGRKRGLCAILLTQRLSKLHKDAAAELNNVFVGRCWQDIDRDRAGDLLGMTKSDRLVLRDLEPGEFFAFGPALLKSGVTRFRSDAVETTHPRPGQRHRLEVPRASEAIREIVQQIGDLPAQVIEETRTLEAAQRRIVELEQALRARPVQIQPKVERVVERIEVPILSGADIERLGALAQTVSDAGRALTEFGPQLITACQHMRQTIQSAADAQSRLRVAPPAAVFPAPARRAIPPTLVSPGASLAKVDRRILTVLAQYPHGKSLRDIAVISGYRWNGGGFNNGISSVKVKGWVTGSKERYIITDAGLAALGSWEPLPTGPDLIAYWMNTLPKAERAALQVLIDHYPNTLDKDRLAQLAGYTPGTGGINNAISRLRTLELATGRSQLRASDILYE